MFYTYILQSQKDRSLYVGWTHDLSNRLREHNYGQVRSTKTKAPWKLIYYEACLEQKDAIAREKSLKTGFGRAYIKRRLSHLYMASSSNG